MNMTAMAAGAPPAAMRLTAEVVYGLMGKQERIDFGCNESSAMCYKTLAHFTEHPIWLCDGEPGLYPGGSWAGHFLPGLLFLLWGAHWWQGTYRAYFQALARNEPFQSSGTYGLLMLPKEVESLVKVLLPPFAIITELYWAHDQYQSMLCGVPSAKDLLELNVTAQAFRTGHMDASNVNNWQHASIYPGFIVSGLVDLLSPLAGVPPGTQQAVLSLSFLAETLLIGLHKKHTPLDLNVHVYAFYAMVANTVFCVAEVAFPRSFLISCGRVASILMQGVWFIASARMLFEDHKAWDTAGDDLMPAVYCTILFVTLALLVVGVMFLTFCLMERSFYLTHPREALPKTSDDCAFHAGRLYNACSSTESPGSPSDSPGIRKPGHRQCTKDVHGQGGFSECSNSSDGDGFDYRMHGAGSDSEDNGPRRVSQNGLAGGVSTPHGWGQVQVPRSYPAPHQDHLHV